MELEAMQKHQNPDWNLLEEKQLGGHTTVLKY